MRVQLSPYNKKTVIKIVYRYILYTIYYYAILDKAELIRQTTGHQLI